MKRKFFACSICLMIISSTIIRAQDTLNIRAFINGFLYPSGHTLAVIDPVNSPNMFDTFTVKLHSPINGSIMFNEKIIFDINGYGRVIIPINFSGNSYYLVLKHRNSIETWSSLPILISGTVNYDFTTSISQAYGNNLDTMKYNNIACIFGGDIDQNGIIDTVDFMIWDTANTNFLFGYYLISDLNGDSNVDLSDFYPIDIGNYLLVKIESPFITNTYETEIFDKINVFPNPANSYCKLSFNNISKNGVLEIFTLMGKLKNRINIAGNNYRMDVSEYLAGMYILKYSSGNEVFSQKLVIEH